jgi:hypothetical protein
MNNHNVGIKVQKDRPRRSVLRYEQRARTNTGRQRYAIAQIGAEDIAKDRMYREFV